MTEGAAPGTEPRFERVLVPVDFSPYSDAALDHASMLASTFGSTVHLLHVLEGPLASGLWASEISLPEIATLRAKLGDDAEAKLSRCLNPFEQRQFHATTHVIAGRPAVVIVEFARDRGVDLIVMGTHGREGVAHLLLGSVSERVVRTAPCPVLTVRVPLAPATLEAPVAMPPLVAPAI